MTYLPPLDELKQLQQQSTPGPWNWSSMNVGPKGTDGKVVRLHHSCSEGEANRNLVALAPVLLAEVIRMKEALDRYCDGLEAEANEMYRKHPHQQLDGADALVEVATELTRILGEENE